MKTKPGRTSPSPSSIQKKWTMPFVLLSLCLVAVVAGAIALRNANSTRQTAIAQVVTPQAGGSTQPSADTRRPATDSAREDAKGSVAVQTRAQVRAPKAVASIIPIKQAQARAAEAIKRQRKLREHEAKEAALKLMLKSTPTPALAAQSKAPASTDAETASSAALPKPTVSLMPSPAEPKEAVAQSVAESKEDEDSTRVLKHAAPVAPSKAVASPGTTAKGQNPQSAGAGLGNQDSASSAAMQVTGDGAPDASFTPQVTLIKGKSVDFDVRNLPQIPPEKFELPEREDPSVSPRAIEPPPGTIKESAASPAATAVTPSAPAPSPITNFNGLDFSNFGFGRPPDTVGDVGPIYFIQAVNASIGIFRKSDNVRVAAFGFNTFMSQGNFGNLCDTNNFGDPVVLYDSFEDRWVITDFAFTLNGNDVINPPGAFQCIAVSKTADPVSGGWNFYSINTTGGLGDYPKFGIWPDGLYMSASLFDYLNAVGYHNPRVYAFNKAQMYAGNPTAQVVSFDAPAAEFTLLPSNARLQTGTPPAGSPNYYSVIWQFTNAVSVYKFHVDWDRISLSTFTGPSAVFTPASWISPPSTVPAQGGNNNDTLAVRLMMQNQYTNLSGVESLWLAHTVRNSSTAGVSAVRYYQVGVTGGTVAANTTQAANHEPDTTNRYMPSLALDRAGNMLLGYNASSAALFPAIRYAGRLSGDAANTLPQTETSLIEGTGSQNTSTRWGDYSAMNLAPDGCTFWYTNEYYATTGNNWQTRIGSVKFPSCTNVGNGGTVSGTVTTTVGGLPVNGATITFGSRTATTNVTGAYSFTNIPAGTYASITATQPGFVTGTNTPVVVTDAATTTKNFSLTAAPTSACPTDTTTSDFQTGIANNLDLTTSAGNVTLSNAAVIDQSYTEGTSTGTPFTSTGWNGQTFIPSVSGSLTKADVQLFCSGCTGTTPNITASIRATSGGLPTGADLASATIPGFSNGAGATYTATFSPVSLTSGTQYALILRPVANPSVGTYNWIRALPGSYANGQRVNSADSGSTWAPDSTRDYNFITYMQAGFALSGDLTSGLKDGNPATGFETKWTTLSWTATTPAGTTVKFQVAASINSTGPFNFVGPDGTAATFFTTTGAALSPQFDGKRYLKYKAYMTTSSNSTTPTLADVTLCYNNTQIPTAARLNSFTATPTRDGTVLLQWHTGTEVDNLGFNVYRDVDGVRTRITPQLVAGSALMAGATITMSAGNAYAWADAPPPGKSIQYFLEDVDLDGKRTLNGPYSLSSGNADARPQQAMLLTQLGNRQAQLSYTGGTTPAESSAQLRANSTLQSSQPFALAGSPAIKLAVNHEGWYRISQPDLLAAGLDPNVNPRNLQLFVDGREVPMAIQSSQSGKFDSTSSIGFYGLGLDAASSDAHVYWLAAGTQPGLRIEKVQAKGEASGATSFAYTVERKDRSVYFAALKNGDAENFFGAVIASGPVDQSLSLQRVNKATTANAQIEVALQGVTQQPHRVTVYLNGTQVGAVNFSGQSRGLLSLPVPHSLLNEGENVVRLVAQNAETDVSLVDVIRITYQHAFKAENNALRLTADAASQVTVDGFTSGDIRVFDVTNPDQPQELAAVVQGQKTGYAVTAGVAGSGPRALFALSATRTQQPVSIKANQPSSLRQSANGADLVIITHRNFAASTANLVALRQKQGLNVAVVDVEDVYDEFSYGNKTPQAIKDFLAYARSNWKQAPQYALLVGDASLDPKNYLGFGDSDFVPTRLIETLNMETASDDWLADFNGNGAEMPIGRLPVRTPQEATAMINKIVSYDSAPPKQSVLLVADRNDSYDFTSTDAALRELIPAGINVDEVNRNAQDDATARSQMFAAINSGQKIVNYVGHGSVDSWRGQMLTNADALALTNSSLPLFITMTCLNGYYQDPAMEGLAESLMKAGRGGAVAVWASSGMTVPSSQSIMNQQMYRLVFDSSLRLTLGEATQRAKALVNDADVRRTWILFGDPTMRLK
ncbi:MAG: C25 family cysteine peptidase [Blastocatellia bacterium]